jgi:hypothetical protein
MTYPLSYDTNETDFLGDLADQKFLVLTVAPGSGTVLSVESIAGINIPGYFRSGDELLLAISADPVANTLTVTRGALGTPIDNTALVGDSIFPVLTSMYFTKIRDRALVTQKYQGLVGLDAAKTATPEVAELYVATDTHMVYVCHTAGIWSYLGGVTTHAQTVEAGETDDHPQYFTLDRIVSWHNSLAGAHVRDGDAHDHRYGKGAGRIEAGLLAARPTTFVAGRTYLATDTFELNIAVSNAAWIQVTGAPSGTIVMLLEADLALYLGGCPTGWTRYSAMDGRFPKGAPGGVTSPLNTGGVTTHTHTYTGVPAHVHDVPAMNVNSANAGGHSHSFAFATLSSGTGLASTTNSDGGDHQDTNSAGDHSHSGSYGSTTTGASKLSSNGGAGVATATTDAISTLPPYQEVIFCQKT